MSEFTLTNAFKLEAGTGNTLKVSVTHETATGKFLDVTFFDSDHDAMVTVPALFWDYIVAAVERQREF